VLIVRVTRGESLVDSLATLARDHHISAATLTGYGVLQSATVESYDPRTRAYGERHAFAGSIELTSLTGHLLQGPGDVVVDLHAALARQTDNGLEALGGHLIDALVVAVEVTVFAHEDITLTVQVDTATGLAGWRADPRTPALRSASMLAPALAPMPTRATPSVPPPAREPVKEVLRASPGARTLSDVARDFDAVMPAKPERADEAVSEHEVQSGDLLEHPAWHLCEAVKETEPGTWNIRILERGTNKAISVEIFDLVPRPARDGKRVWQLKPRGR
jgi:hypothetical protein